MSNNALWDIPSWWEWKTIGDLGDVVSGGTPSSKEASYWGGEINWISPADLTGYTKKKISKGSKSLTQIGLENSSAKLMPKGSVHFSSRAPIGYVVISDEDISTNQGFKSLVPKQGVFNEYVYYYLKSSKQLAEKHASGTTFLELSGKAFRGLPIPLPPEDEQKNIVAKIETLFSELDKGIESLKTARQQLKAYRQAVLKHAFEGKLTDQWRQQNLDKLENPEQLLARIQQEREQRYRQQLEEWKQTIKVWEESGKEGKMPSKPKKARGEPEPFVDEIEVPPVWGVTTVGALNVDVSDGPFGSNLKSSDYVDHGVRVIRLENVGYMEFIEEKHSYVTEEKYEKLKKHTVSGGDLIFSSFITEGVRTVILPEKIDRAINKADCFCIRVHGRLYLTEFLAWFLSSRSAYKQVEPEIHGIGRPRINTTQLKRFTIPICSIDEQKEVVSKINAILSDTDHMEETLDSEVQRAEALRQSILKKAFFGQLTRSTN